MQNAKLLSARLQGCRLQGCRLQGRSGSNSTTAFFNKRVLKPERPQIHDSLKPEHNLPPERPQTHDSLKPERHIEAAAAPNPQPF